MAKFLPVIGEIFTTVESGAKLVGAAAVLPFSTEKASELLEGAGRAWVDYSEQNVIAAPINMGVRTAVGDEEGTEKVKKELEQSFHGFVDGAPVVGHVKGAVHYATGDWEHGDKCMKQASRTAATIAVAVGTGILTGGAGTVAHLAVTTAASTAAGVGMDIITTGVDSVVHDEFRPTGVVEGVATAYEKGEVDINAIFDSAIGKGGEDTVDLAADCLVKGVDEATGEVREKTEIKRKGFTRSTADVEEYAQLEKAVGEQEPKQSVELARNVEEDERATQITATESSLKTGMDTESYIGVSRTVRQNTRELKKQQQVEYKLKGCPETIRKKQLKQEKAPLKKEGSNTKPVKKRLVYEVKSPKSNSKKRDQRKCQQKNEKFKSARQQKLESSHTSFTTEARPTRRASQHAPNKCKRPVVRRKTVSLGANDTVTEAPKLPANHDPQVCAEHAAYESSPDGNPNNTALVSVHQQGGDADHYTIERWDKTVEGCDTAVEGCDRTVEGCDKTVEGCDKTVEGCDTAVKGCDKTIEGCDKTVEVCDKTVEGWDKTIEGCDKTVEGCDKTVEGCDKTDEGCDKTVEGCGKTAERWDKTVEGCDIEGCGKTVERWDKAVEGCDKTVEGWDKTVEGWDKTVEGCDKTVEGCDKTVEGCDKTVEGCGKKIEGSIEGWDNTVDGWDKTVEGCYKTVEGCDKTVEGCDKTVEGSDNCKTYFDVLGDCKTDKPNETVPLSELGAVPPLTLKQCSHVDRGESGGLCKNGAEVAEFGKQDGVIVAGQENHQ